MHANKVACKTPNAGLTQPPSGMLRDVHPNPGIVRRGRGGGTAHALRAVRQFMWLEVDSVKMALSRPTPAAQYPKAATLYRAAARGVRKRKPLGG